MTSKWLITGHKMSPNTVTNITHTRKLRREKQINVLSGPSQIVQKAEMFRDQHYNLMA